MSLGKLLDEYEKQILDERSGGFDYNGLLNQLNIHEFFRFRPCKEETLDCLEKDLILFSSPAFFNDGYDTTGFYDLGKIKQRALEKYPPSWKRDLLITDQNLVAFFNDPMLFRLNSICCFSTELDSMLMWSLYADSHKGFCVKYSFDRVCITSLKPSLIDGDYDLQPVCYLMPVVYSKNRLNIQEIADYFADLQIAASMNGVFIDRKTNPTLSLRLALVKATEWSYEHEWRLVVQHRPNIREVNYPRVAVSKRPTAVYLGSKISEENKAKIIEICRPKRIKMFQAHLKNTKQYQIEFEEI